MVESTYTIDGKDVVVRSKPAEARLLRRLGWAKADIDEYLAMKYDGVTGDVLEDARA